jgi:hypothetical protein
MCKGWGYGVLGLRQINTCRKVHLQVIFLHVMDRTSARPRVNLIFFRGKFDFYVRYGSNTMKNRRKQRRLCCSLCLFSGGLFPIFFPLCESYRAFLSSAAVFGFIIRHGYFFLLFLNFLAG